MRSSVFLVSVVSFVSLFGGPLRSQIVVGDAAGAGRQSQATIANANANASAAGKAMDMTDDNTYPSERLERIVAQFRRIEEYRLGDRLREIVPLLADIDPWVRLHAMRRLGEDMRGIGLGHEYHPMKRLAVLQPLVDDFLAKNKDTIRPYSPRNYHPEQRGRMLLNYGNYWAETALLDYSSDRFSRLGEKSSIYPVIALLQRGQHRTQAWALHFLVLKTECDLTAEGVIHGEIIDVIRLEAVKSKWMTWWKENEATFKPRADALE